MCFLRPQIHPSLVINMDQTGVHLVPASSWTYERLGSSAVATVGADDKRQITACLASSLYGDLLPLQLIFEGKTDRSLPNATEASKAVHVHITRSENHWSSQQTMRDWIVKVLLPYTARCIQTHSLRTDSKVLLVLDVWAVHKSEEFRRFLRTEHPHVHLVFVPANCTSKLQVADVALQRPFKSAIRRGFERWAAQQLQQQLREHRVVGLGDAFRMSSIKPKVLQWCVDSWCELQNRKDVVAQGWYSCCTALYDVHDPLKRAAALAEVARRELDDVFVPDAEEAVGGDAESEHESDDEKDELDTSQAVTQGERRSARERTQARPAGFMINSQQIAMTEDSEF